MTPYRIARAAAGAAIAIILIAALYGGLERLGWRLPPVDADGRGSFEFTVPTTVQIGALEIVATDAATGQSASAALEIVGQPTEEPGDDQPGTEEPGDDQPGTDEPGDDRPGAQDPGTQPGAGDPKTDAKDGGLAATGAGDFTAVAALAGLLVLAGAGTLMARRKA